MVCCPPPMPKSRERNQGTMVEFMISAQRSPDWNEDEVRRRLGKVYRIILDSKAKETVNGGEFGDLTPSTADDAPTSQPAAREIL